MSLTESGRLDDQINNAFSGITKTATTSNSNVSVGGSNLSERQEIFIFNTGSIDLWVGPTGATPSSGMIKIEPDDFLNLHLGELQSLIMRTVSGSTDVVIWEMS